MKHQFGLSLIELTAVVAILGITALVVIPHFSSIDPNKLELAAEEFAEAMRFARSEAMRLGEPVGFQDNSAGMRIRVFRVDTGTSPWTEIFDVYHPVSKKLYTIDLAEHPFARAEGLNHTKVFRGTCNSDGNIYFDSQGIPWCIDPENVLVDHIDITFSLGEHTRVVTLDGITGLVTVQ